MTLADSFRQALEPGYWFEGYSGMTLDDWQKEMLNTRQDTICNVSRQAGKSFAAAVLAVHHMVYYPGSLVIIVSYNLEQSLELGGKCRTVCQTCRVATSSEAVTHIYHKNGSRIMCLCGAPVSVRGYSADLLIVDEASRVPDELYYSIRPMLSVSKGRMLLLSTPWIKEGFYYDVWEADSDNWHRIKVSADQIPRISPDFLLQEQKLMPKEVYEREYYNRFMDVSMDCCFNMDLLKKCVQPGVQVINLEGGI